MFPEVMGFTKGNGGKSGKRNIQPLHHKTRKQAITIGGKLLQNQHLLFLKWAQ